MDKTLEAGLRKIVREELLTKKPINENYMYVADGKQISSKEDIDKIVKYLWQDELNDFIANPESDHIFTSLFRIAYSRGIQVVDDSRFSEFVSDWFLEFIDASYHGDLSTIKNLHVNALGWVKADGKIDRKAIPGKFLPMFDKMFDSDPFGEEDK
jgi:hypothetical protein